MSNNLLIRLSNIVGEKWRFPAKHLIHHRTETPPIDFLHIRSGLGIVFDRTLQIKRDEEVFMPRQDLGGDVVDRPTGHDAVFASDGLGSIELCGMERSGAPEVDQLQMGGGGYDEVVWFDVAGIDSS